MSELRADEGSILGWGSPGRLVSGASKRFADTVSRERLVHGFVQPGDDFARNAGLGRKANPILHHQLRKTLLDDSRHILERSHPLRAGDGKRSKLAGSDEFHGQGSTPRRKTESFR